MIEYKIGVKENKLRADIDTEFNKFLEDNYTNRAQNHYIKREDINVIRTINGIRTINKLRDNIKKYVC